MPLYVVSRALSEMKKLKSYSSMGPDVSDDWVLVDDGDLEHPISHDLVPVDDVQETPVSTDDEYDIISNSEALWLSFISRITIAIKKISASSVCEFLDNLHFAIKVIMVILAINYAMTGNVMKFIVIFFVPVYRKLIPSSTVINKLEISRFLHVVAYSWGDLSLISVLSLSFSCVNVVKYIKELPALTMKDFLKHCATVYRCKNTIIGTVKVIAKICPMVETIVLVFKLL